MVQYLITALAGIAIGIVAMRLWNARESLTASPGHDAIVEGAPAADASPADASADLRAPAALLSTRNLLAGAGVLGLAGAAILLLRSPDQPGAASTAATSAAAAQAGNLADVDTMIAKLAERLKQNPADGEGFRMLGWSYVMTGRPEKAIEPFKRALALLPGRAVVHSGYGEALVGVAGGKTVTPEAKSAFEKALTLDPVEPRARYFLALWQAQNGQAKEALDKLVALANSGQADAPWQADVRREAENLAKKLGVDATKRFTHAAIPGPASAAMGPPPLDSATVQAAAQLPEGQRQAMVDTMVESLAAKLKTNPGNVDGWVMLLRSRMVLKQSGMAGSDLAAARKALSGDAAGRAKVDAAARELSIPGA